MDSDQTFYASMRLKIFMIVIRAVGVVVALILTGMNNVENLYSNLPFEIDGFAGVLTAAVIFYHLIAAFFTFKTENHGMAPLVLVAIDLIFGMTLTYYYGPAYLFLSFALPILMVCYIYGAAASVIASVFGTILYCLFVAFAYVNRMENDNERSSYLLYLGVVQICSSYLLTWIFCAAAQEGVDRISSENSLQKEKDVLFQEIQTAREQNGQISRDLSERDNQLRYLNRDNASLKEELETSLKRLQEARVALQNSEKKAEDQGREASQAARREKIQIQRQLAIIQQRLERQNRLFEVSRKLSGSLALSDTLLALTEQLQTFLPCQSCIIFMLDEAEEGERKLFAEVAASPFSDIFHNYSVRIGEGAPGYAVAKLTSLKIDDGSVKLNDGTVLTTIVDKERSAMVAPLAVPSQTIGVVYLGRAADHAFTEDELDLLIDFCEMASVALGNSLLYQRAVNQGVRDPLTGCYNSLFLEERINEELKRGNRYMYAVSLLLFSIDGYSHIVENLGQDTADSVLREVVIVVRSITREVDVLARLEDDTFALLIDHADRVKCAEIGARVCEAVAEHSFVINGKRIRINISIGAAGSPHDAANSEQLTVRASSAMQQAQQNGGNQVCLWK